MRLITKFLVRCKVNASLKDNFLHQITSCIISTETIVITETTITYFNGENMQHITTQPKIIAITQTYQSVFKKSTFVIGLAGLGSLAILAGIISMISAMILISNTSMPGLSSTMLADAAVVTTIGTLIIASSRAFAQGKLLAIWFYGGSILLDSLYSLLMGYELHYIFIGLGFLLIWQMLKFRKEWEAS